MPELTEERRVELTKVLKNLGEKSKVSIRNIRREANDTVKKLLKEKKISEDESKNYEKEIQENTDENINKIEKILTEKEKEILKL
jgi:ribosome recycling factor